MSGIFVFRRTISVLLVGSHLIGSLKKTIKMPFYAVARGRSSGIYNSWADCEAQVKGFSGARFKKFDTASGATEFINANNGGYSNSSTNLKRSYSTSSANNIYYGKNKRSSWDNEADSTETEPKKSILIEPPQPKRYKRNEKTDFEEDNEGYVQVYTDGACSANGKHGARAGLGVYWGENHRFNTSQPVSGRATNNCGEIQAATHAIKTAQQNGVKKLVINTDSQFLINAATKWMPGWKRRGWKLASGEAVKNEIDFKELDSVQNNIEIKWNYVKAHNGQYGNEMADKLAKAGAAMYDK